MGNGGKIGIYKLDKDKKHLYVVTCGPYMKIGCSNNPENRIKSLQASCPFPISLFTIWKDKGHLKQSWHEKLKSLHHSGEWYKIDFNILREFKTGEQLVNMKPLIDKFCEKIK